jgi:protein-S-isoprenylcysteine O-methyltransferase Ste14
MDHYLDIEVWKNSFMAKVTDWGTMYYVIGFMIFVFHKGRAMAKLMPPKGKKPNFKYKAPESTFILFRWTRLIGFIYLLPIYLFTPFLDCSCLNYGQYLPYWTKYIACAFLPIGIILNHYGHNQLGKSFAVKLVIKPEHKLIKSGLFAYIRHPLYLAVMLQAIARSLLIPNYVLLAPACLQILLFMFRMPKEEEMMRLHFGEEFDEYKKKTTRLIPFIF